MISSFTISKLRDAVKQPDSYCSGAMRKQLQVTYDKMLDELSLKIFNEPCTNRMVFRQKINANTSGSPVIASLKNMLKRQESIFSKEYRDHSHEVKVFLVNDLNNFLKVLCGE